VEVLTAGAAKALGSLWGGLGAVAQRVEAARVTLAKELGGLERKLEVWGGEGGRERGFGRQVGGSWR
jgi:hypothetical protein